MFHAFLLNYSVAILAASCDQGCIFASQADCCVFPVSAGVMGRGALNRAFSRHTLWCPSLTRVTFGWGGHPWGWRGSLDLG
jgi:hypothetical protein